jgi:hypothetical protein
VVGVLPNRDNFYSFRDRCQGMQSSESESGKRKILVQLFLITFTGVDFFLDKFDFSEIRLEFLEPKHG